MAGNSLTTWQKLYWGQTLNSANGYYQLKMQWDGNLVIYETMEGSAIWASNTAGNSKLKDGNGYLTMTDKGAAGLMSKLDESFKMYWNTNTWNSTGASLVLTDNGSLVVKEADGTVVWNSRDGDECWWEVRPYWGGDRQICYFEGGTQTNVTLMTRTQPTQSDQKHTNVWSDQDGMYLDCTVPGEYLKYNEPKLVYVGGDPLEFCQQ